MAFHLGHVYSMWNCLYKRCLSEVLFSLFGNTPHQFCNHKVKVSEDVSAPGSDLQLDINNWKWKSFTHCGCGAETSVCWCTAIFTDSITVTRCFCSCNYALSACPWCVCVCVVWAVHSVGGLVCGLQPELLSDQPWNESAKTVRNVEAYHILLQASYHIYIYIYNS